MKYDEKEELEKTSEWLLRINKAGFSEELEYVPSELSKLGVAPVDVVDRLDYLRDRGTVVIVEEVHDDAEEQEETVPDSALEEVFESPIVAVAESLILDYDSFGPWEWASGTIEEMIQEAIMGILDPEPGLHEFNDLSSLTRKAPSLPAKKGKRRRAALAAASSNQG